MGNGLLNRNGTVDFTNSTFADNTVNTDGGAIYVLGDGAAATVTINNTIALRNPWSTGTIDVGIAFSNNTYTNTYNYASLRASTVPQDWIQYSSIIQGIGKEDNTFRAGTEYLRTVMLLNHHSGTDNLITWDDIEFRPTSGSYVVGETIDLKAEEIPRAIYRWIQTAGPMV